MTDFIGRLAAALLLLFIALALAYGCLWALDGIAGIVEGAIA